MQDAGIGKCSAECDLCNFAYKFHWQLSVELVNLNGFSTLTVSKSPVLIKEIFPSLMAKMST